MVEYVVRGREFDGRVSDSDSLPRVLAILVDFLEVWGNGPRGDRVHNSSLVLLRY